MKTLFLLPFLLSSLSFAGDKVLERYQYSTGLVEETLNNLEKIKHGPSAQCLEDMPDEYQTRSEKKCIQKYENFYADKDGDGKINMDIFLGYADKDNHKMAVDPLNKLALMTAILKDPCPPNVSICGFRATDDGDLFVKTITVPGGKSKTIQLRLKDSAVGVDNHQNETKSLWKQTEKSMKVREAFRKSLRESDAVFYLGHSRYGGGPDFSPPILTRKGKSDEAAYKARRQGLGDIVDNMNGPPKNLKFLGLFSCNSRKYFRDSIRLRNPGLQMVGLNQQAGDSVMIPALLGTLDSMLGMHCDEDFNHRIDPQGNKMVQQN